VLWSVDVDGRCVDRTISVPGYRPPTDAQPDAPGRIGPNIGDGPPYRGPDGKLYPRWGDWPQQ